MVTTNDVESDRGPGSLLATSVKVKLPGGRLSAGSVTTASPEKIARRTGAGHSLPIGAAHVHAYIHGNGELSGSSDAEASSTSGVVRATTRDPPTTTARTGRAATVTRAVSSPHTVGSDRSVPRRRMSTVEPAVPMSLPLTCSLRDVLVRSSSLMVDTPSTDQDRSTMAVAEVAAPAHTDISATPSSWIDPCSDSVRVLGPRMNTLGVDLSWRWTDRKSVADAPTKSVTRTKNWYGVSYASSVLLSCRTDEVVGRALRINPSATSLGTPGLRPHWNFSARPPPPRVSEASRTTSVHCPIS
mmetsp:Transcript_35652/g.81323  ORF Transcript_35652/g.81323 Transcript_35652/m.81323 type:complete len:300 (+) Transcript_35652:314-1213(+)